MKRLSVLIGITQGLVVLTASAFAGDGSAPLFALNKISGPIGVVGLSDNELARVEGSTVPRPPRTVSQSNSVEQRNSATDSQGDVVQENRLVQTNGGNSGSNQSNQAVESYILAAQATIQKVLQQTLPWASITAALGNGSATVITENRGTHTTITVTHHEKSVTQVGSQTPEQAVRHTQSVEVPVPSVPVPSVPRIDQAANPQIPSLPPGFNISGSIGEIGHGFGGGGARF